MNVLKKDIPEHQSAYPTHIGRASYVGCKLIRGQLVLSGVLEGIADRPTGRLLDLFLVNASLHWQWLPTLCILDWRWSGKYDSPVIQDTDVLAGAIEGPIIQLEYLSLTRTDTDSGVQVTPQLSCQPADLRLYATLNNPDVCRAMDAMCRWLEIASVLSIGSVPYSSADSVAAAVSLSDD